MKGGKKTIEFLQPNRNTKKSNTGHGGILLVSSHVRTKTRSSTTAHARGECGERGVAAQGRICDVRRQLRRKAKRRIPQTASADAAHVTSTPAL